MPRGNLYAGSIFGLALAITASIAAGQASAEQRCDELGASCICSEPLNVNETISHNNFNLSDSPAATDCGDFLGTSKLSAVSMVPEFGMPSGDSVDYVLQGAATGTHVFVLDGRQNALPSEKRMCIRYYKMVDDDYSGVGPDGCPGERSKIITFKFGGTQWQTTEPAGGSCTGPGNYKRFGHNESFGWGPKGVPSMTWDDCNVSTGWCRFENCVSGDLAQGRNIRTYFRVTRVSDGEMEEMSNTDARDADGPLSVAEGALYRQGDNLKGKQYISHYMQASWDTDDGQWIGPAAEIEGAGYGGGGGGGGGTGGGGTGGGGTGGGGTTEDPPAAPVLLPD